MLASARWHTKGPPIVYTAEHPALALLEILVHVDRSELPTHYQWLTIELPDDGAMDLGRDPGDDVAASRELGDKWLAAKSSLALRVPSVVAPHSFNYLINPAHPRIGAARVLRAEHWPVDGRLG